MASFEEKYLSAPQPVANPQAAQPKQGFTGLGDFLGGFNLGDFLSQAMSRDDNPMGGPQPKNYWNVLPKGAMKTRPSGALPPGWTPPNLQITPNTPQKRPEPPPAFYQYVPPAFRITPSRKQDIQT
jgi:hypothetical protein